VLAISKKGWVYAPWKKPSPKTKAVRDPNAKFLFEDNEWATDDATMNRALKSLKMYSFNKDGQNRGERVEDGVSIIHVGQVRICLVFACICLDETENHVLADVSPDGASSYV